MPNELTQNTTWEDKYKNQHVDTEVTSDEFVSAFRTCLYARECESSESITGDVDNSQKEFRVIGVVQSYNWNENRDINYIFELGSDIPYIVPGRTIGQIALQRVMINGNDVVNALYANKSYGGEADDNGAPKTLNSLKDITKPFDLLFVAFSTNGDGKKKYSRVFKNCQIEARSESIQAGSTILAEQVQIRYETIVGVQLPA